MKHLTKFEDYKYNEEDMMLEEWKLPTYQDMIKRKLSFLKSKDLSELEPPVTHLVEIKKLWQKVMKKMYTKEQSSKYIELVDNFDVHKVAETLELIKKIKDNLSSGENIGQILYHPEKDKIYYYERPTS